MGGYVEEGTEGGKWDQGGRQETKMDGVKMILWGERKAGMEKMEGNV